MEPDEFLSKRRFVDQRPVQRLLQRPSVVAWPQSTVGPNVKKPANNEIQKIREIDGSYSCLQGFDKFRTNIAWNDQKSKLSKFAETFMEKIVKITLDELI